MINRQHQHLFILGHIHGADTAACGKLIFFFLNPASGNSFTRIDDLIFFCF